MKINRIVSRYMFLVSLFLTGGETGWAQQLPLFSQFMQNDYFLNPAVAGSRPYYDGVSANRIQWVGLTDAPRTYCLSLSGPIRAKNLISVQAAMGVGGYVFTDIVGPMRRNGISGSYAYHIKLSESVRLGFSLSAGILQYSIDASKLTLYHSGDYVFAGGNLSRVVPDLGTSLYFYEPQKNENALALWYLGAYIPQIFPAKLNLFETPSPRGRLATHLYITAGYRLLLNDEFTAEPVILLKVVNPVPPQLDAGARIFYKNKMYLGGTYRTMDAISAMVGYIYKENFYFGYSYDITTTNLKNYQHGTHELMLAYRFGASHITGVPALPQTEE